MLLNDYHFVIDNTGVPQGYTESDPTDYLSKYEALYQKLKNGEKLIWEKDYEVAGAATGITRHLENCTYKPTSRLCVPDFLEPCLHIETFCFLPWKDKLSTAFYVGQFPENICGLQVLFPSKVDYLTGNEKHAQGIVEGIELEDNATYQELVAVIKSRTKPLRLEMNGKIYKTAARVSAEAKKDLQNFYFIVTNQIRIS